MNEAALAVFIIGLRHGADPDHLAAIDNLTRNASERMPRSSRFVGTLFALGHSAMVLAAAALAGVLGARLGHASTAVETVGRIASIVVLLVMATLNVTMLARGGSTTFRSRLLPRGLREATHVLVAIPTGALFGFGFETSSQLVAYGTAFSSAHLGQGMLIGASFCFGMICTDTVDSLLVARVVASGAAEARNARRAWIAAVTLVALAVAAQEIVELLGGAPLVDELRLSAITIAVLAATAAGIALGNRTRAAARQTP
ncbi:MAG: nickel permease [Candidatus Velthaea sp.]